MSTLETFVLPWLLYGTRTVNFVVKKSLVRYPLFGPMMASRDPVLVGRRHPRRDLRAVLEEGLIRLRRKEILVVFQQTTRMVLFDPKQFSSIGVKLAHQAGVSVIPMAVKTDAWSNGRFCKDLGRIHPERPVRLAFGEPIEITGSSRCAQERALAFILQKLREWDVPVRD